MKLMLGPVQGLRRYVLAVRPQDRDALGGQELGRKGPSSQANCTRLLGIVHRVAVYALELGNRLQLVLLLSPFSE